MTANSQQLIEYLNDIGKHSYLATYFHATFCAIKPTFVCSLVLYVADIISNCGASKI